MNGVATAITTRIATIFGTKVSGISWTCVRACSRAIPTPTIIATANAGAAIISAVQMPSRNRSMASVSLIAALGRCRLNRHPQDFLIGLHHLVANGDCRVQGQFRRHHGLDDLLRARLALRAGDGGGFALPKLLDRRLRHALHEVAEGRLADVRRRRGTVGEALAE